MRTSLPGLLFACLLWLPLVATLSVQAHPKSATTEIEAATGVVPSATPFPGAADFAEALIERTPFLLTEGSILDLEKTLELLEEAEELEKLAAKESIASAAIQRSTGQERLLSKVGLLPNIVEVHPASDTLMEASGYLWIPSDFGAVVFRIDSGQPGGPNFRVQNSDLTAHAEFLPNMQIRYATQGVTWVLMTLERIQTEKTIQLYDFIADGSDEEDAQAGAILVETPPLGRLKLRILDENANEVPAMVSLVAVREDRARKPEGALDFSEQMDVPAHGLPSYDGAHWFNHSSEFKGRYWCVPDPVDMDLPGGEWEVRVRRGFEYVPVHKVFSVTREQTTEIQIDLERWVDMPSQGWYSGDDHIHSRLLNQADSDNLLVWLEAEDLYLGNILRMGDHLRTFYDQRGFGPDYRVERNRRVLVPGQEDPRFFMGHSIGLNLRAPVRDEKRYLDNTWIADTIHEQGGLYGHAHLAGNLFDIERDLTLLASQQKSDFAEILQFNRLGTGNYYDFLDLGFKLTASAGSDVPYGSTLGENRVYAFLGPNEPFTPDAWFAALARGRTFVTNGPMLDLRVEGALPGDEIECDQDRPLHVIARAIGATGGSAPAKLRLIRFGETIAEASAEIADATRLEIDVEVPAGEGFWIAAAADGRDGSKAHTTPVYVRRHGFRSWDAAKAAGLIADRRKTLATIRGIILNLQTRDRMGRLDPLDFSSRSILDSATDVFQTADTVAAIYDRLEASLEEEKARRPKGTLTLTIAEATSGLPLETRVTLFDPKGLPVDPSGLSETGKDFLVEGDLKVDLLPGNYSYRIDKGKEYLPAEGCLVITREGIEAATVELERVADWGARGWYAGDLASVLPEEAVAAAMEAEDLHILVASQGPGVDSGTREETPKNYPNQRFYWEEPGEEWGFAETPTGWGFPVEVVEGKIDSIGILNHCFQTDRFWDTEEQGRRRSYRDYPPPHGHARYLQDVYFHTLNCGFHLPPGAASGAGKVPNPVGFNRVYVYLEKGMSWEDWWQGFRAGRCFVTNGPLLEVRANSRLPGATFEVPAGATLEVRFDLELVSTEPVTHIELIRNGTVEQSIPFDRFKEEGGMAPLTVEETGWFLVRVLGKPGPGYPLAMTGPFYMRVGDLPCPAQQASAAFFFQWLEDLEAAKLPKGHPEESLSGDSSRLEVARKKFRELAPAPETRSTSWHPIDEDD